MASETHAIVLAVNCPPQAPALGQATNSSSLSSSEDIEPEDMTITHCAALRGQVKRGMRTRARGRSSPKNHYQVNLELFLEDLDSSADEDVEESEF